MGKFGWSLPPGVTHRMIDESMGLHEPCECCGLTVDDCICEECPTCGEYGNPGCYKGYFKEDHGMEFTTKQLEGRQLLADQIEADQKVDDALYEEWKRDRDEFEFESEESTITGLKYEDPEIFRGNNDD